MDKYSEVIGMPVICIDNGKKIGTVRDLIFCPRIKAVKGFLLERKGYEVAKRVILLKDVLNMGRDALVVNDCSCITPLKKLESIGEFKDKGEIKGLRVYTKTGSDLGVVKDILFDYKTGSVEGVEVSDGFLQDLVQGRNIVPLFGRVEFSDESIVVDKEAIDEMMTTGGGLKNFLNDEKEHK